MPYLYFATIAEGTWSLVMNLRRHSFYRIRKFSSSLSRWNTDSARPSPDNKVAVFCGTFPILKDQPVSMERHVKNRCSFLLPIRNICGHPHYSYRRCLFLDSPFSLQFRALYNMRKSKQSAARYPAHFVACFEKRRAVLRVCRL